MWNAALDGMGEKVPLVGVGDTREMSHFESRANISSASLSSWVDSSSCCASVGGRVRRLRDERRAEIECAGSSQTLAVLPSGVCTDTQEGAMRSSNALRPSTAIQSDQGMLAAMQAACRALGGRVAGDKGSVSDVEQEERKAEDNVDWSTI